MMLGLAAPVSAHVGVESTSDEPGAYVIVTLSVPHGCGLSPTTRIAIQMPEGINSVTPTRHAFYTLEKVTEEVESTEIDEHGNPVTRRQSQIIYTATTPLPADQRDTFELSLRIPEDAAGQTLHFPTVQTCEEGEDAWVQIPAEGQDSHELEFPAPALEIRTSSSSAGDDGSSQTPLVIGGLAAGLAGLLTGAVALLRTRKAP